MASVKVVRIDILKNKENSNMKVIVGSTQTGKSTIMLHYVYNEIEKLVS